jgi:antitoxin PrlF
MPTATVTSKGQITIPLEVRTKLGIRTGTKVHFVETADGSFDFVPATGSILDLYGVLEDDAEPPMTLDQMDQAIADHVAEEDARTRR